MLDVLYEDNHLLVVNKPAPLATMGAAAGEPSLVNFAKEYVKQTYQKPGNVYLGVVSRLDAFVTGVVLFARTSKAASRLTAQFHDRQVKKEYVALISEKIDPQAAPLHDWLRKEDRQRRMVVCNSDDPDAKEARLSYRRVSRVGAYWKLEVTLATGRKHQIRVQLATRGFPIVGDAKYGSDVPFPRGIALHSYRLAIEHPTKKTPMEWTAPLPDYWG